ncbi:MAG: polynucleotide adenylyltransferase PcnB [Pseudomonadota bacterium]
MPPSDSGEKQPVIIPRPQHNVSRSHMSKNAQKVLYRLHNHGYQAFLVGGGVRDLLLGHEPKDFDIATNASPEEVKDLFRNCRLIGRRFRLAHVHFGRDIIEVATFRAAHDEAEPSDARAVVEDSGRILRDNIYGEIGDDVWRRDFTANALYYNIADYSIWDYVDGVEDIRNGVMRLIGDPETRFREDPVRMLRAVRFAAKLGFTVHKDTEAAMVELGALLDNVPAARLFDESLKLFLGGFAHQCFELLQHYDLFRHLLPATAAQLETPDGATFRSMVSAGLTNTDRRVADDRPVTPMFLFAVFLWGPIRAQATAIQEAEGGSDPHCLRLASDEVIRAQQSTISVPRRFTMPVRDIICMQPAFQRRGRAARKLLNHPRFRAAYDLMLLRQAAGEVDEETAKWWTDIQAMDGDAQQAALSQGDDGKRPRRRRRRRSRRGGRGRKGGAAPANT